MTDRELLELAAKAAGMWPLPYWEDGRGFGVPDREWWNPLTDDGDALRLAVKLRLHLEWWPGLGKVAACTAEKQTAEPYEDDPNAATRRAIVSAAAEIGKGLRPFPSAEEIREEWT